MPASTCMADAAALVIDESGRVRNTIQKSVRAPNGPSLSAIIHSGYSTGLRSRPTKALGAEHAARAQSSRRRCEGRHRIAARHSRLRGLRERLKVHYKGRYSTPGYHCAARPSSNGRGELLPERRRVSNRCGGCSAFLAALAPAGLEASVKAAEQLEADHETTVEQFAEMSSVRATARSAPNAVTAPSIPITAWSRAVSKRSGEMLCAS